MRPQGKFGHFQFATSFCCSTEDSEVKLKTQRLFMSLLKEDKVTWGI